MVFNFLANIDVFVKVVLFRMEQCAMEIFCRSGSTTVFNIYYMYDENLIEKYFNPLAP